ncbi:MAG: YfhO family protein, partial [Chloroflexi bacterium]|nr:YfhO family protein [Chloroflexota bacterium]
MTGQALTPSPSPVRKLRERERGVVLQIVRHIAALVFLWAVFFWRHFSPIASARAAFPDGDFTQQFYIFRNIAYRALAAGRLPLWSECFFAGYSFHADPQSQLFYPPIWIVFAILKLQGWGHFPIAALNAEVAAHYLLAALFTYAFLRAEVKRPSAALFGAIVFTFGGYLAGYPALQSGILETATWLPLILLALRRLVERGRPRDVALAALPLAIAFFAGHPQTFLLVFYLSLAYFIYRARVERRPWQSALISIGATAALAALLASAQLIPQIEYLRLSSRAALDYNTASAGFPPQDIAQLVLTGLVSYWHPLYVGLLPLALALLGLSRRTNTSANQQSAIRNQQSSLFWLITALAALGLSLGSRAAGYDLAYWLVPGYRLFRGQERAAIVVSFSLAVLAAHGSAFVFAPLSRWGRRRLRSATNVSLASLPLALALLIAIVLMARAGIKLNDPGDMPGRAGLMVVALALTAAFFAARAQWPSARRWMPALAVAIAAFDLFSLNRPLISVPDFDPYPYLPILDPLRGETGFFRLQEDARLKGHSGCAYGFDEIGGISPIKLAGYGDFMDRAPELVRWQLLGAKYVVTWREAMITREDARPLATLVTKGDSPGGPAFVYRLDGFIPRRAFLIHSARLAAG